MDTNTPTAPAENGLLTTQQTCARWKTTAPTLRKLRREGRLKVVQFGKRSVRYALSELLRFETQEATA